MTDMAARIAVLLDTDVTKVHPLGVGSSGSGAVLTRVTLADGQDVVAKSAEAEFSGLTLEAWMLETLASHGLPVPAVHHAEDRLLVMDYVPSNGGLDTKAQENAADAVAALHDVTGECFGLDRDTVIGPLPQPNPQAEDWRVFFAEHRLRRFARKARDEGRLSAKTAASIDRVADRVDKLIPAGSVPSLIHGDLWGGNVMVGADGRCRFIDPAIYYADAEVELAYSTLSGTFGDAFFGRYREHRPIAPGFFEERRDLYNLYPLLVHTRLFGGHYAQSVERIAARFA
ncbi:fructosamine kinase family protein [Parvularcula dongshanensis]|uniref:Fructosamine-3-kinase n=1 Tax=Parvularcula dongshanensis TaxID=1173995 RepID=A0A840I6H7_9PROT|nr:fructosamine kinase family protein [Parvularcula dongshanensis]MBB4659905.1 fructosamine-3-kinase [Parvularcula dongshanensis]